MKDIEAYLSDTLRKGEESGARYVRFEIELLRYLVKRLESDRELIESLKDRIQMVNISRRTTKEPPCQK